MTVTEPTRDTAARDESAHDGAHETEAPVDRPAAGDAVIDDVLVEEISIDGMCGVY